MRYYVAPAPRGRPPRAGAPPRRAHGEVARAASASPAQPASDVSGAAEHTRDDVAADADHAVGLPLDVATGARRRDRRPGRVLSAASSARRGYGRPRAIAIRAAAAERIAHLEAREDEAGVRRYRAPASSIARSRPRSRTSLQLRAALVRAQSWQQPATSRTGRSRRLLEAIRHGQRRSLLPGSTSVMFLCGHGRAG